MAKLCQAPFLKVEATKFTEVGFHGKDVDQIIRDLLDVSIGMTKKRLKEVWCQVPCMCIVFVLYHRMFIRQPSKACAISDGPLVLPVHELTVFWFSFFFVYFPNQQVKDAAAAAAEERILSALVGVNLDDRTKEAFRQQLKTGQCEDVLIDVDLPPKTNGGQDGRMGVAFDMNSASIVASELFGKLAKGAGAAGGNGKKKEHRRMKVSEARYGSDLWVISLVNLRRCYHFL